MDRSKSWCREQGNEQGPEITGELDPNEQAEMIAARVSRDMSLVRELLDSTHTKLSEMDLFAVKNARRFSISATPPHAGVSLASLPNNTLAVNYPIVVVPFGDQNKNNNYNSNDVTWFDAASIYRNT